MDEHEPGIARLWKLKGQGNANAVFAYTPDETRVPSTHHDSVRHDLSYPREIVIRAHHVLRIRKVKLPENNPLATKEGLADLEEKIWNGIITDWSSGGAAQEQYENKVLRPLLGGEHIHQGKYVRLPLGFAAVLARHYGLQLSQDAWIVQDHTVFQEGPAPDPPGELSRISSCAMPTICLEVKPKWGVLATSPCIHPKHSIKLRVPRFQLHQQLKAAQGKVHKRSAYNPLDLFSGDSVRMQKALKDLLACPQNNLRLFIDGEPVAQDRVEEKLSEVSPPYGGSARLLSTIVMILQQAGVLKKVKKAQSLDIHDVEGVKVLLDDLLAEGCKGSADSLDLSSGSDEAGGSRYATEGLPSTFKDSLSKGQCEAVKHLLELDRAAAFQVIREYLTAATAKDLSIMITLRRTTCHTTPEQPDDSLTAPLGWVEGPDLNAHVLTDGWNETKYKVALVDLDMKPLRKISEHWRLDTDIMRTVSRSTVSIA